MNLLSKNYKIFENRNSEDLIIRPINSTILDCTSYNKYKTEMNDAIAKILKKIA
jgi:hypothetical protein